MHSTLHLPPFSVQLPRGQEDADSLPQFTFTIKDESSINEITLQYNRVIQNQVTMQQRDV
jgi:hypothetical protein